MGDVLHGIIQHGRLPLAVCLRPVWQPTGKNRLSLARNCQFDFHCTIEVTSALFRIVRNKPNLFYKSTAPVTWFFYLQH